MKKLLALGLVMLLGGQASAGFLSTDLTQGVVVPAPAVVKNDSVGSATGTGTASDPYVMKQWGFFERAYVLTAPLAVDTGSVGAVGDVVESYMIFLNKPEKNKPDDSVTRTVKWDFDNQILGVMSDVNGGLEFGSSFLQRSGTDYGTAYNNRGLEGNARKSTLRNFNRSNGDAYFVENLFSLHLRMSVTQPGDWIRVVTSSNLSASQVPEPTTMALWGLGAAGLGMIARRRKNK